MHLMHLPGPNGSGRCYTLKKVMDAQVTKSAHPARFSPDDKWSRHLLAVRKRFAVLMAQRSELFLWPPSHPRGLPRLRRPAGVDRSVGGGWPPGISSFVGRLAAG